MSEYQYYEFQAIDRPLTNDEQVAINNLSSRAEVTPNQPVFKSAASSTPGEIGYRLPKECLLSL
jgi:hypothetical protein